MDPSQEKALRQCFQALYDRPERAMSLLRDAGIPTHRWLQEGPSDVRWAQGAALISQGAFGPAEEVWATLTELALQDYPANSELRALAGGLPRASGGAPAISRGSRSWAFAAAVAAALALAGASLWEWVGSDAPEDSVSTAPAAEPGAPPRGEVPAMAGEDEEIRTPRPEPALLDPAYRAEHGAAASEPEKAPGDLRVHARGGSKGVEAGGGIDVEAASMEVKAEEGSVGLQAEGDVRVKASKASIDASGGSTGIKSSGNITLTP